MKLFINFVLGLLAGVSFAFPAPRHNETELFARQDDFASYQTPSPGRVQEWIALGDSFSAGVGANSKADWIQSSSWCYRSTQGYPMQMNSMTWGGVPAAERRFNFNSCTGDKIPDMLDRQLISGERNPDTHHPNFGKPQLAVVSISGNDFGFGKIVNACVFHWGRDYGDCETEMKAAEDKLSNFNFEIHRLQQTFRLVQRRGIDEGGASPPNSFQVYVTPYVEFWDENDPNCNTVSWAPWYKAQAYLTIPLRKRMNKMVRDVNNIILQAIDAANNYYGGGFFLADDWKNDYDTHRFCRPGTNFKSPTDHETWFFHSDSKDGIPPPHDGDLFFPVPDLQGDGEPSFYDYVIAALVPEKDGKSAYQQLKEVNFDESLLSTALSSFEATEAELQKRAEEAGSGFTADWSNWLYATWIRVFHPKAHAYYAQASSVVHSIENNFPVALGSTQAPPTPDMAPLGDKAAQCDGNTDLMPKEWLLLDSKATKTQLLYRMRDQACQGLCAKIEGVPDQFIAAKKDGDNCEYSVKIADNKEMWLSVSHKGQNCYDAAARIDEQCKGNSQGGWINGPNDYEFYQFGIRNMNAEGSKHEPFTDPQTHLGYPEMRCTVRRAGLADEYKIWTANFDDGNYGKSIQESVHKHCGAVGAANQWKYEEDNGTVDFQGGHVSNRWGSFRSPWFQEKCTADTMAVTMGLQKGMVECTETR